MILPLAVLAFATATLVVLFGDSPSLRHTPLHRARVALLGALKRATDSEALARAGWTVPVFYIGVLTTCLYLFLTAMYPMRRSWPQVAAITAVVASVYALTAAVVWLDPGAVAATPRWGCNNIIFFANRCCRTCHTPKPARLKHCSTCRRCVAVFDHHCVWLNNCIGDNNYRWFVAFLAANIAMLSYGAVLTLQALQAASHHYPRLGWWALVVGTTAPIKVTGTLAILCVVFAVITAAFTALHARYLYLGVTTNELDKWGEIEWLVECGLLYHCDAGYVERTATGAYISLDDEHVVYAADPQLVTSMAQIDNVYDQGFVRNVRDRLRI